MQQLGQGSKKANKIEKIKEKYKNKNKSPKWLQCIYKWVKSDEFKGVTTIQIFLKSAL